MAVTLKASDGQEFLVETEVASKCTTIKNLIADAGIEKPIPLPNVTGPLLSKVVEFCKYHHENGGFSKVIDNTEARNTPGCDLPLRDVEIGEWDKEFCNVDQSTLFDLILASNYLDIQPLLDLSCCTVANMIKGKTAEQIRQIFNIVNDFTPEEEEQVRKENEWCQ